MTDLIKTNNEQSFSKFEQFNSLGNGEFWRAKIDSHKGDITAGQVLMIAQIDDVDNAPHTVHVRLHPSKVSFHKDEVKFLIDDFLGQFEFVEKADAERIRAREIKEIQDRINNSQTELQEACVNIELMDALVDKEMPKAEAKDASVPIKYEAVGADIIGAIKTQKVTALMSKGLTETGVGQIKAGMENQKAIAERRSEWITSRTTLLTKMASEMTPFFQEKAAVALALTKDMTNHVKSLMNGIQNLNLYVLKDVEIETLREGADANESLQLSVAQRVLYMDEELAVWANVADSWDFRDEQTFKDNIAENADLISQIFPTERSIVSIAASRRNHNYREMGYSSFEAEKMNRENLRQFILVRNGENIHIVRSPDLFHNYSKSLFPTINETKSPFRGYDGNEITYTDLEYTKSLEAHETIAIGYKRLLILLCGLDHNKQLFGKFYNPAFASNFVSISFQEKYFNFIHDLDGTGMLPTYRPATVNEWISDLNSEAGVNSRVIFNWENIFTVDTAPSCFERDSFHRSREDDRSLIKEPLEDTPFLVRPIEKSGNDLFVRVKVGSKYDFGEKTRDFDAKVQVKHELLSHRSVDILCIDRLNPDDAMWYLKDRATRTLNLSSIRIIKHAIKWALLARAETQELRDKLLNAVLDAQIVDTEDKETGIRLIDTAIAKWQCNSPKRDINELLDNNKGFNAICDQIYQLSDKGRDITPSIIEEEKAAGRTPLRVSLLANGKYVSYSTPSDDKRDDRLIPFQWVEQVTYKLVKHGIKQSASKMVLLAEFANNETVLFEDENLSDHVHSNITFKTPNAKDKALSEQFNFDEKYKKLLALKGDEQALDTLIAHYVHVREQYTFARGKGRVLEPVFSLAFAHATHEGDYVKIAFQGKTHEILAWLVQDTVIAKNKLMHAYPSLYSDEEGQRRKIEKIINEMKNISKPLDAFKPVIVNKAQNSGLVKTEVDYHTHIHSHRVHTYSYAKMLEVMQRKGNAVYITDEKMHDLDSYLGIKAPDDFNPVMSVTIDNFFNKKSNEILVFEVTDDILKDRQFTEYRIFHNIEALHDELGESHHTKVEQDNHFKVTSKLKAVDIREFRGRTPIAAYTYEEFLKEPVKNPFK